MSKNSYKVRATLSMAVKHVILIALGFVWMYPFLWMVGATFKTNDDFWADKLTIIPSHPTADNVVRVWTKGNFNIYFMNTVIVTVCTVLLVLVMTNMAGYVMGRYRFVGKKLITTIFVGSITIPIVTTIIPVYELLKNMHLVGTRTGLILSGAGGAHVIFLLLFSGFYQTAPNELEEAARMDGCGFGRVFVSIFMPLAKPVSITCVIMETIWTWNAFMLPLVLTLNNPMSRTLAVGLYSFRGENVVDWTGIAAGGTISVVPIIIVFIALQKYFVNGVAGAVKS